jgi:hypothetical protein
MDQRANRIRARQIAASLCGACAVGLVATGCGTTGLAWVHERESGVDMTPPAPPSEGEPHAAYPANEPPNESLAPPADRGHQRLDRSITLGATEYGAQAYDAPLPYGDPRAPTIVNVYVSQPPGVYAYGASYGYYASPSFVSPGFASVRAQPSAANTTMRPGLDWPAVPNPGPAFPYRTGPASPWSGAEPRRR